MGEGTSKPAAASQDESERSNATASNAPSIIVTPAPIMNTSQLEKNSDETTPQTSRISSEPINGNDAGNLKSQVKDELREDFRVLWMMIYTRINWILPVLKDYNKMKPVIRSAITAWVSMIFLIINPIERQMGTASFLIVLSSFVAPTELPILGNLERELYILLLTTTAWAYSNLAIFFAHLARNNRLPQAETVESIVYAGGYIETAPTAICATFLGVGAACCLYLKIKFGPSPFFLASVLGCIALDITLVYGPLFPYPIYTSGQAVVIPLAYKSAISIAVSFLFFPKSINSVFVESLIAVIKPLASSADQMLALLQQSPTDPNFNFDMLRLCIARSEAGLLPLRVNSRLSTREVTFALANADDLHNLAHVFFGILAPADGISYYFNCIKIDLQGMDIHWHPHMSKYNTPVPTRPGTPTQQYSTTSKSGLQNELNVDSKLSTEALSSSVSPHTATGAAISRLRRPEAKRNGSSPTSSIRRYSHELRHRLQGAIHPFTLGASHNNRVEIGLWESLRYAAVESQMHNRVNDSYTTMCFRMLSEASQGLVKEQSEAYKSAQLWLSNLNHKRWGQLRNWILRMSTENLSEGRSVGNAEKGTIGPKSLSQSIEDLANAIEEFKIRKKKITEPFKSSVDQQAEKLDDEAEEKIPHRYLFQSFTYCYFQILYSTRLLAFLKECDRVDKKRTHWKFYLPKRPKLMTIEAFAALNEPDHDQVEDHYEDPEYFPGMVSSLGATKARDPEVMFHEKTAWWQKVGMALTRFMNQLFRGNALFMWKAGIITVVVSLPSYVSSSAGWAYRNKAIWTIFMAQLCLARHRGQVLFNLINRFLATLMGACLGMLVWYISSGNGVANPFAIAVVTAFAFVGVMVIRLYMPASAVTVLISCLTISLIIGYSWKDSHNPVFGSPGVGWAVAWRRFTEVVIGCTAAYIMAILPPSSSMRKYYRLSHSSTLVELGGAYCQVITLAVNPNEVNTKDAMQHLIAIRTKIRKLMPLKSQINYEWSFRGQWPLARYEELERVEMEISKLLSHSIVICEHIGPVYSRALLRRTHFLDPVFLADCIAILTMCATSLRTSRPLPQIVPILIERYLKNAPGFQFRPPSHKQQTPDIIQDEERMEGKGDDDCFQDLPKVVTYETICKDEYQAFAVGVTVAYGIVLRLDRLCLAVKELVGETYSVPTDLHSGY